MKAFLNYSGKGGVGKTTITYCIYKAMKELKKKVLVIDMDLNTPSMHHLIKNTDLISNHEFQGLFLDKSTINLFLRKAIDRVKTEKPDVLLIDTPPSITDIHFSIIDKLKISAVVLISQPTELSKSDVERTVPFFENKGITVIGIVENMVEDNQQEYNYHKLLEVPKSKGLDSNKVFKDNKVKFIELSKKIIKADLQEVSQENRKRILFDENIEWENIRSLYGILYDEHEDRYYLNNYGRTRNRRSHRDIKFVNLKTWKKLHKAYCDIDNAGMGYFTATAMTTDCIHEATYERVERLVKSFEQDDKVLFFVTNAPKTNVPIIVGEVGIGTLKVDDKFQGIPTIEYQTNKGIVRMFPHEVIPATTEILNDCKLDGYEYIEEGKRFIPPLEILEQYANAFGSRVGAPETKKGCLELINKVKNV